MKQPINTTKKTFSALIIIALIIGGRTSQSRVSSVKSVSRFEEKISGRDYELSVVMFYWHDNKTPKELTSKRKAVSRIFKQISDIQRYKETDVKFIKVNISKALSLAERYSLSNKPEKITFMLFYQEDQYQNGSAQISVTDRNFTNLARQNIKSLIEDNFGNFIDEIIERQQKEREERRRYRYDGYYYPRSYYWYGLGHHGFRHGRGHRFRHGGGHRGHGGHHGGHGGHGGGHSGGH